MRTDAFLIARLALELEERLRGARVTAAGVLADGRVAVALRSRGGQGVLAVDAFGSPPLLTFEPPDESLRVEPGFSRALDATLRGTTLTGVRARDGDRLLTLEFGARSRFGVGDEVELSIELVPRFGNAILVKRGTVVAALKEFAPAENARRTVLAGMAYELPPLPATPPAQAPEPFEGSVLELFANVRAERLARGERERVERRRAASVKRLEHRERKLLAERSELEAKRRRITERDALRDEGERIFATLHERELSERDEAKDRAAELFARYKKLGASLPHVERRFQAVGTALEAIDALRWETERADAADLDDVEEAVAQLEPHRAGVKPATRKRKRAPLEVRTPSGSRIFVGRNPAENADLTFRVARPNDLWFHAQGTPGAHVILARDDRTPPSDEDVETAAALAAYYSKARAGTKVAVDYTLRKHVRKQQDAPAGLVWYTHPKTIYTRPRSEEPPPA